MAVLTGYVLQVHEFPGTLRIPQDGERRGVRRCFSASGTEVTMGTV